MPYPDRAGFDLDYQHGRDAYRAAVTRHIKGAVYEGGKRVVGSFVVIGGITYTVGSAAYNRIMGDAPYGKKARKDDWTTRPQRHRRNWKKLAQGSGGGLAYAKRSYELKQQRRQRNGFEPGPPFEETVEAQKWIDPVGLEEDDDEETGGGGPVYNEVSLDVGVDGDPSQINSGGMSGPMASKNVLPYTTVKLMKKDGTGHMSVDEQNRYIKFAPRASATLPTKNTEIGVKRKRRRRDGMVVPYLERCLMPFYASSVQHSGANITCFYTASGTAQIGTLTDDVHAFPYEGNRQQVWNTELFDTAELTTYVLGAMGVRTSSVATNLLPMFSSVTEDDVPSTYAANITQSGLDRFRLTTKVEICSMNQSLTFTNLGLSLSTVDIYIFQSVGFHSVTAETCFNREYADYNARLAKAVTASIPELNTQALSTSVTVNNLRWFPYVGKHTAPYWRLVKKQTVGLGAVKGVTVTLNGPLGVVPLSKFCKNATDADAGIPGSGNSVGDDTYNPYSYSVWCCVRGGELAGDASVATTLGTCSGQTGYTGTQECKLRVLPNYSAVAVPKLMTSERPLILDTNCKTISVNTLTWKNTDDVTA